MMSLVDAFTDSSMLRTWASTTLDISSRSMRGSIQPVHMERQVLGEAGPILQKTKVASMLDKVSLIWLKGAPTAE